MPLRQSLPHVMDVCWTERPEARWLSEDHVVYCHPPPRRQPMIEPLLQVQDLHKHYREGRATIHAVNGISFDVFPGEAVGLVGESGCGKTDDRPLHPAPGGRHAGQDPLPGD